MKKITVGLALLFIIAVILVPRVRAQTDLSYCLNQGSVQFNLNPQQVTGIDQSIFYSATFTWNNSAPLTCYSDGKLDFNFVTEKGLFFANSITEDPSGGSYSYVSNGHTTFGTLYNGNPTCQTSLNAFVKVVLEYAGSQIQLTQSGPPIQITYSPGGNTTPCATQTPSGGQTPAGGTPTTQSVGGLTNPLSGCNDLSCIGQRIISFLQTIAYVILSIMVLYGGFQMMTAGGNEEKFTNGRKTLTYAVIGIAIVIIASGVAGIVKSLLGG